MDNDIVTGKLSKEKGNEWMNPRIAKIDVRIFNLSTAMSATHGGQKHERGHCRNDRHKHRRVNDEENEDAVRGHAQPQDVGDHRSIIK
jgi:hypothetical protein